MARAQMTKVPKAREAYNADLTVITDQLSQTHLSERCYERAARHDWRLSLR